MQQFWSYLETFPVKIFRSYALRLDQTQGTKNEGILYEQRCTTSFSTSQRPSRNNFSRTVIPNKKEGAVAWK